MKKYYDDEIKDVVKAHGDLNDDNISVVQISFLREVFHKPNDAEFLLNTAGNVAIVAAAIATGGDFNAGGAAFHSGGDNEIKNVFAIMSVSKEGLKIHEQKIENIYTAKNIKKTYNIIFENITGIAISNLFFVWSVVMHYRYKKKEYTLKMKIHKNSKLLANQKEEAKKTIEFLKEKEKTVGGD
ncbi:MAG: hypothetical protein FWE22_01750 [Firmicutes bacterium]|nr:hypothetical protein [Bacillota bacterium]